MSATSVGSGWSGGTPGAQLSVLVDDVAVTRIDLSPQADRLLPPRRAGSAKLHAGALRGRLRGGLPAGLDRARPGFLIDLAGLSKLVGMVCPGRHSICRGFSVIRGAEAVGSAMRDAGPQAIAVFSPSSVALAERTA